VCGCPSKSAMNTGTQLMAVLGVFRGDEEEHQAGYIADLSIGGEELSSCVASVVAGAGMGSVRSSSPGRECVETEGSKTPTS
jgi:hypothetical protein